MTQAVLENVVSEAIPSTGTSKKHLREIANQLSDVLADSFRLRINVQGLHWNVVGPMFYSIHKITEQQYKDIASSIDVLGERVRALGLPAIETLKEYETRSVLDDLPKNATVQERVARLIADYETAIRRMKSAVTLAEKYDDVKTADLLTERIGAFEENVWMLKSTIDA